MTHSQKFNRRPWAAAAGRAAATPEPGLYPHRSIGHFHQGGAVMMGVWQDDIGMWSFPIAKDDCRTPELLRQQGWKLTKVELPATPQIPNSEGMPDDGPTRPLS